MHLDLPDLLPFLADAHPPVFYVMMIPLGSMVFALFFILVTGHFRNQEEQRRHETARIALEKGQPVPAFADSWNGRREKRGQQKTWVGLMIGGFVNVAVGVGTYIMLGAIPGAYVARWCSLIPGLIGVALLLSALIVALTAPTQSDSGDHPPLS
jgi:hypothetical protein